MTEQKSSTQSIGQRKGERGVALIIALLALTVLTGIGFAIMVSSSTESLINAGFRRAGLAHFAAMGGVEEMRGRMGPDAPVGDCSSGSNTSPANACLTTSSAKIPCSHSNCTLFYDPEAVISGTNPKLNMAYYILRSTTIDPTNAGCTYLQVSCYDPNAGDTPTRFYYLSQAGAASSYVWVKVTVATQKKLKRRIDPTLGPCNPSDPLDLNYCDPTTLNETEAVYWNGSNLTLTPLDPPNPVFIFTALSIQPGRATRVVRELGALGKTPSLPGGLVLDGCPAIYPPPTSHPYQISGIDSGSGGDDAHAIVVKCVPDLETVHNLITDGNKPAPEGVYAVATPNNRQNGVNYNPRYPGVGNNNCNNPQCTGNNSNNAADIVVASALTPDPLATNPFLADCAGVQRLVSWVEQFADYTYPAGTTNLMTDGSLTSGNGSPLNNPDAWNRVINVIDGNASLSQADFGNPGAGIILVKGNLDVVGYPSYNGLILVIGTGSMTISGGGNGTVNGGVLLANTTTCTGATPVLGPVIFDNPGGGTFNLNYNSDAIKPKDGLLPVQRLSLNY